MQTHSHLKKTFHRLQVRNI
uniref:Uncharacterized protein n=1 Tax=Anguilla anguilla TaxID=7936 RepID=A0A0E9QAN1_ANGAN